MFTGNEWIILRDLVQFLLDKHFEAYKNIERLHYSGDT